MARLAPGPHPGRTSQMAEMVLMDEMRWASMALAVSLASSADQRFVSKMRSSGTQWAYTDLSTLAACKAQTR